MIAVFAILGCVALGVLIGLIVTAKAPMGYQDETGFHYGPPEKRSEEQIPQRIPQPELA